MVDPRVLNEDNESYLKFTGPARLDKAVSSLAGFLRGIRYDSKIVPEEMAVLKAWHQENMRFRTKHPYNELLPAVSRAVEDEYLTLEEAHDLIWLCERVRDRKSYYDFLTADMQQLHGILGGVAADGKINIAELDGLSAWIEAHPHLKSCYPFDEIETLITQVLKDGRIDATEHQLMLAYFGEFIRTEDHKVLQVPLGELDVPITGLCAVCPTVEFGGKTFCFTGASDRLSRKDLAVMVVERGGAFTDSLTLKVDYLVIGSDGNPCWCFACYGRKVERAIEYRRKGSKLLLVHENDFWDAVQ